GRVIGQGGPPPARPGAGPGGATRPTGPRLPGRVRPGSRSCPPRSWRPRAVPPWSPAPASAPWPVPGSCRVPWPAAPPAPAGARPPPRRRRSCPRGGSRRAAGCHAPRSPPRPRPAPAPASAGRPGDGRWRSASRAAMPRRKPSRPAAPAPARSRGAGGGTLAPPDSAPPPAPPGWVGPPAPPASRGSIEADGSVGPRPRGQLALPSADPAGEPDLERRHGSQVRPSRPAPMRPVVSAGRTAPAAPGRARWLALAGQLVAERGEGLVGRQRPTGGPAGAARGRGAPRPLALAVAGGGLLPRLGLGGLGYG